jgi:hypothetical protein
MISQSVQASAQDDVAYFSINLDVHAEITCDENYNHYYTNDVENIHLFSPRGIGRGHGVSTRGPVCLIYS